MKVGTRVRFRRVSDHWMNLWIKWFHDLYGHGPHRVSEVVQGQSGPMYKLQPCVDVAFSRTWLKTV